MQGFVIRQIIGFRGCFLNGCLSLLLSSVIGFNIFSDIRMPVLEFLYLSKTIHDLEK
jgi:hypothetical protein